ncbi:MAG: hypothetical protein R3B09_29155 [Nannocystaceae bacterium]
MKLARSLAIPFLAMALSMGCGDKKPGGTTPPGETGGGSEAGGSDGGSSDGGGSDGGSSDGGSDGGSSDGGGGEDVSQKVCDAEVSDTPTALFADKLILRLPKGVELVEKTPFLMYANKAISTCDAEVTMFIGYFQYDPKGKIKEVRDQTIGQFGFPANEITGWTDETESGANYTGTFEIGQGPKGEPPTKGLVVFKEAEGIHYYALYTAHPNAWNAIKNTFAESAKRIRILKAK